MSTQIPEYPVEFTSCDDEFVKMLAPALDTLVQKLKDLSGAFEKIREADSRAEAALETSTHPLAVQYREVLADFEEAAAKWDAEEKAERDAFNAAMKAKYDEAKRAPAKAAVAKVRAAAVAAESGEQTDGLDPEKIAEEYGITLERTKKYANNFADAVPQMKEWAGKLPSRVKQAKGATSSDEKRWTPRLAEVLFDGERLPGDTQSFGALAKHLKLSPASRQLFADRLQAVTVVREVPTDHHVSFTVTIDGKEHTVSVIGAPPKEKAAKVEADTHVATPDSETVAA